MLNPIFIKVHRWFGLTMCVLFVTWFLSGFVMLYAGFPQFGSAERLRHASLPDLKKGIPAPADLFPQLAADTSLADIRLVMLEGRPVYRILHKDGNISAYFADTGDAVPRRSAATAESVAVQYLDHRYQPQLTEEIRVLDQWIPRSSFLVHMPVFRITMNDPGQTMIYVSSKTGEIIQAHDKKARLLAWCGPVIHWIYPRELIIRRPLWRGVVDILSVLGIVASLSGIITGFIRMRKIKNSNTYTSPYKKRWFRWHHYTGFVFGLFTFTWVFSGLLTMSPLGWTPELSLTEQDNKRLQGGNLELKQFTRAIDDRFQQTGQQFVPVEISLRLFQGIPYYIACNADGKTRISRADTDKATIIDSFPLPILKKAVAVLNPGYEPAHIVLLDHEDNYYYSKHKDQRLPVLRLQYDDPEQNWYYADPSTGEIVLKNNRWSRINRWLYHGFHSLDFFNFQHYRPVWDIVIWFLLAGGTAVSMTGIMIVIRKYFIRR